MKWSKFILKIKEKNRIIIYNILNGAVIELEKNIYDNILKKNADKDILEILKQNEMIIDSEFNEDDNFKKALLYEWNNCNFLDLHLVVTTGCNFKCPYCYQKGIKSEVITIDKADRILKFLDMYVCKYKIKESAVEITGGEPTTNWDIAKYLLEGIDKIYKKYKIEYKTYIVTNGYEFTSEKVDFIAKYNWKRLQITLDGLDSIHNTRRILAGGKPTFDKIIQNIDYIIKNNKISKINLRINYDKSNINYVPDFLKYIKEKFGVDKFSISLGLITKTVNCSEANVFIDLNGIEENDFVEKYIKLYKCALKLGFEMSDIFSFDGMCTAKLKHGFLIEPNGNLVKCVSGVGRKEFVIGNIDELKDYESYFFLDLYDDCLKKNCPFVPICHTSCRFDAFIKNGDIKKINCKRDILEKINKKIIKIYYGGD